MFPGRPRVHWDSSDPLVCAHDDLLVRAVDDLLVLVRWYRMMDLLMAPPSQRHLREQYRDKFDELWVRFHWARDGGLTEVVKVPRRRTGRGRGNDSWMFPSPDLTCDPSLDPDSVGGRGSYECLRTPFVCKFRGTLTQGQRHRRLRLTCLSGPNENFRHEPGVRSDQLRSIDPYPRSTVSRSVREVH